MPLPLPKAPSYRDPSYSSSRRIGQAKTREFTLVSSYTHGYRNREDVTMLPPGVLVQGSQNVVTNVFGRVSIVQGFALDGAASVVLAPVTTAFDYEMHTGQIQHLRACLLTTAGNDGKLQYRYVNGSGTVTWRDLLTSLTSTSFNFTNFWDTTNLQSLLLMVNGASSVTEWTGGVTTIASVTVNTLTKSGTTTWAEEGFYTTGTHSVVINGVTYQATGGWGTLTLTGVGTNPVGPVNAGDIAHQLPETTANGSLTGIPSALTNDLISILRNQVYLASLKSRAVYISKVNNYKDFSFTAPVRVVGEGALVTLDGPTVSFAPQEDQMYISGGKDFWYQTKFTLDATNAKEAFEIVRLKTTNQQGTQSQAFTTKVKNDIVFLSNEPIINSLGRVDNVVLTPQITDLSNSIVNDMNMYDFTSGSIFYWRNFILVAVPKNGLIRIYNKTNPANEYWEAPVGYPITCFSIIDGDLYGHSYQTSESYKLFTGYNFNGAPVDARAIFSFENYGVRTTSKSFNEYYVEGYISANTTLTTSYQFDIDGCATILSKSILGTDTSIVCIGSDDNSLGKKHLGENPLGADIATASATSLPPKFRVVLTSVRTPFYEFQPQFTSYGIDFHWELIAHGPAATPTYEGNNNITIW